MIHGERVAVITVTNGEVDAFGVPERATQTVWVDDVLVAPGPARDVNGSIRPDGVRVAYTMHFPKSFSDDLTGAEVEVRGERFTVIGSPKPYTVANTPTRWWMPVEVEATRG